MLLGNGYINVTIRFKSIAINIPAFQYPALGNAGGDEFPPIHVLTAHFAVIQGLYRRQDAAVVIAAAGFIAGPVKDAHLAGAGLKGQFRQGANHQGVGGGGHFRRPVKADVGFDHYSGTRFDKSSHASDQINHLSYQSWVILVFADTDLGQNEIARCCLGDRGARKEGAWPV